MYISDKDALQSTSRLILIIVPILASMFDGWSWIIEILLLFTIFIHQRSSGLKLTAVILAAGYLGAMIVDFSEIFQMGFTPWAGVLMLWLKERGLSTAYSIFWSLLAAAFLSAFPLIPLVGPSLQPENIQRASDSAVAFYEQQGMMKSLEEQGITSDDFEKYLGLVVPIYYKLLPGIAGILGMFELGLAFILSRISIPRARKKPFALLTFPWYSVWFTIGGLLAYLGGDYLSSALLEIIGLNVMAVMAALALVLGFSWLSFMIKHPKMPRLLIWVILFAGLFLPYFVLLGLMFIGLFDPVMNVRRIPENFQGGKQ